MAGWIETACLKKYVKKNVQKSILFLESSETNAEKKPVQLHHICDFHPFKNGHFFFIPKDACILF